MRTADDHMTCLLRTANDHMIVMTHGPRTADHFMTYEMYFLDWFISNQTSTITCASFLYIIYFLLLPPRHTLLSPPRLTLLSPPKLTLLSSLLLDLPSSPPSS